jgi:uncharacterized protein
MARPTSGGWSVVEVLHLVVEELGSEIVATLWDGCDAAQSSRLAHPEVTAALAAAQRNHDLDDDGLATATPDWAEFWASMRPVELTRQVEQHAGELARRRALRGTDAVHLASALAINGQDVVVAV